MLLKKKKVNGFDTSGLVKKTDYNSKIKYIKDKIPNLATTAAPNGKINEVKGEIPSITGLTTTTALNDVKNNIPDVSTFAKKADYDIKVSEIEKKLDRKHDESIATQKCNKLTAENFEARLEQANLATKADIADFVKKTDFNDKLKNLNKETALNKTKHILVENKFEKLQTYDSSLFIGQRFFSMMNDNVF